MAPDRRLAVLVVVACLGGGPLVGGTATSPLPLEARTAARSLVEPPPAPAPSEVRRATEEVLSRRAYATEEPSWWARWAERARRWLAERLLGILTAASRTAIGWAILGVAVAVALVVAWRLTRGTRWERPTEGSFVDLERRTAEDWAARSRAAEEAGDLREAIRTAYRAAVAGYARAGLVEEVAGRTVGEYRRDVGAADPLRRDAFERASDVVEGVLYAEHVPTTEDLAAVRAAGPARVGAGR